MKQNTVNENQMEVSGKGKPKKKILLIVSAVLGIALITLLIPMPNHIKNKTFKNDIAGTYVCTDVIVVMDARKAGYNQGTVEKFFMGSEIRIDEDGYLYNLEGFREDEYKLSYAEGYFNAFEDSYILYSVDGIEDKDGHISSDYDGIIDVYYSKEGSQIAADTFADSAMVEVYCKPSGYTRNTVGTYHAFVLTFEKQ